MQEPCQTRSSFKISLSCLLSASCWCCVCECFAATPQYSVVLTQQVVDFNQWFRTRVNTISKIPVDIMANIKRISKQLMNDQLQFDEIGYWSEIKLEIVKEYARAYSTILAAQKNPSLDHVYIDAFAGAGVHLAKATGEFVAGSPLNALSVLPPFQEYHLIDIKHEKAENLRKLLKDRKDVFI